MIPSWDESMETGDPSIDKQHREIIGLVDEFKESEEDGPSATRGDVYDILSRVMDITVEHFVMEEGLMRRVDYEPKLAQEMIAEHREFTAYARLRVLEFRNGETACVRPLHDFLREWLIGHEFGLDRQLAAWIREHQAGSPG